MLHLARRLPWAMVLAALGACSCDGGGGDPASGTSSTGGGEGGAPAVSNGPGPVAVASSTGTSTTGPTSTSSTSSTSSGGGGGDPGWRPVPWWKGSCAIEYAENPAEAFPALEWTSCEGGVPGCEVLVKNWPPWSNTGQTILDVQREGAGHELSMSIVLEAGDNRMPLVATTGRPRVAYRRPPESNCSPSRALFGAGGHWVGAQDVAGPSTYVFQPDGLGPDQAVLLPLTNGSQGQAAGPDVFALELEFAVGVRIFDRAVGKVFSSPPAVASYNPQVTASAVFFMQANDTDDPSAWVWDRTTGAFRELIGAGANVVADVRGDDETLVWIETPPVDPERGGFPPGVLYTSPFTTDPKALVPTARWSDLPVSPGARATLGGGLYAAVGDATRTVYILRISDGRRWTVPIPDDEFASDVKALPYIDGDLLFLVTGTQIHRIHLDALGAGMPAE